jgi:hypothetical protein
MPLIADTLRRSGRKEAAPGQASAPDLPAGAAWIRWMGPAALAVLVASATALAAGDDSYSGPVYPSTDMRREILSPYRYVPHPVEPSPPAPFLAKRPPPPGDQRLAEPAQSDLREPHVLNRLDAALLREQSDARAARVASRLGIGVSSVRLGKHVVLGAATAFYVPVGVGLGIVW